MKKNLLLLILLAVFIISCEEKKNTSGAVSNEELKTVSDKEQVNSNTLKDAATEKTLSFDDLMKSAVMMKPTNDENYSDFKKTKTGLIYKFHRMNDGATLTKNDVVEIEMNYFVNDSLLFSSQNYPRQFKMPVEESIFAGDFYEGLSMMHVGDSASFVVRADSTFVKLWKRSAVGIKSTDKVRFDISIISKEDRDKFAKTLYEKKKSQAEKSRNDFQIYLSDNQIYETPRPSGLIMVPIIKGYGPKATSGDMVRVHINATLIDGTSYMSTRTVDKPELLTLSNLPESYPRGLDEALHQMREGDVTKVIIPYNLAFGQEERPGVPPFANFVFEVEVLELIQKVKQK